MATASLMGGAGAIAAPTQRIAQAVVDGLPPPPISVGQFPSAYPGGYPGGTFPQSGFGQPIFNPNTPVFLVLVNGNSQRLLNQVRRLEPSARIRTIDDANVIQAGVYATRPQAEQQVQVLATQGIVGNVASTTYQIAFEVAPPTAPGFPGAPIGEAYYLVVPSSLAQLDAVSAQIIRLGNGFRDTEVRQTRESPLGPHVRVGPIVGVTAAERWNRFLRDFGLDSRIYAIR
ncbi:MAG: hypothetical protein KME20_06850 [Kaiparowitsia implicata GSE-PSE-MK54-09C]|nr:hypothetical protein [Kaiparowitsia implicata GSE-PSE-MK54-09C]